MIYLFIRTNARINVSLLSFLFYHEHTRVIAPVRPFALCLTSRCNCIDHSIHHMRENCIYTDYARLRDGKRSGRQWSSTALDSPRGHMLRTFMAAATPASHDTPVRPRAAGVGGHCASVASRRGIISAHCHWLIESRCRQADVHVGGTHWRNTYRKYQAEGSDEGVVVSAHLSKVASMLYERFNRRYIAGWPEIGNHPRPPMSPSTPTRSRWTTHGARAYYFRQRAPTTLCVDA